MTKQQCFKLCKKTENKKACRKQCKTDFQTNDMECNFTTPKTFDGSAPATSTDFWQYSEAVCTSTEIELIRNTETGAEFYIDKTITYGDFILFSFLMVALIFGIAGFLIKFLIPKLIHWKR